MLSLGSGSTEETPATGACSRWRACPTQGLDRYCTNTTSHCMALRISCTMWMREYLRCPDHAHVHMLQLTMQALHTNSKACSMFSVRTLLAWNL